MSVLSRRLPWLACLAVLFTFLTLCLNFGLRQGGSLTAIAERAALTMVYPIQKGIDIAFSSCEKTFNHYVWLVGIEEQNRQLEKRIAELSYRLAQLDEVRLENRRLHELLNFKTQFDILERGIASHVIGRQTNDLSRILIVDCGTLQGIRPNNPVFTPGGVIGRVVACGRNSAKVLLLTDQNSACDVIIQRNRVRGTLQGTGDQLCRLAYLQNTSEVKVGDRLITSGLDNIFPKGITVGTVVSATHNDNGISQSIRVKPEFDLDRIEEVYILPAPPTI